MSAVKHDPFTIFILAREPRRLPEPTVDTITGAADAPAPNREPRFVLPAREQAAQAKLDEFVVRNGKRPNALMILFALAYFLLQ